MWITEETLGLGDPMVPGVWGFKCDRTRALPPPVCAPCRANSGAEAVERLRLVGVVISEACAAKLRLIDPMDAGRWQEVHATVLPAFLGLMNG